MTSLQTPVLPNSWAPIHSTQQIWQCRKIWVRCIGCSIPCNTTDESQDLDSARFTPCFVPVITALPTIVAVFILLTYALRSFQAYRPRWTKPFVEEPKEKIDDMGEEQKHRPLVATLTLLAIISTGLALQIMTVFIPGRNTIEMYPSIAWVSTCVSCATRISLHIC